MGLIFKRFHEYVYCEECNTLIANPSGAFSELSIDRPVRCSKCGGSRLCIHANNYYVLRGTTIKIPSDSIFAKMFILTPNVIFWTISAMLFANWIMDVLSHSLSYALNEALDNGFFNFPYLFRGAKWPGAILISLTLYYLFQTAGSLYDIKKWEQYKKAIAESRWEARR
jgi:hypothetical protein